MLDKRIPSLDGLRALAIGLVLIHHFASNLKTHYGFQIPLAPQEGAQLGFLGVTVFFVISGFLITTLLCEELSRTATISLPRFYFRRTLRLLPAYYTLIAIVAVSYHFGTVKTSNWNDVLIHALTYTTNYNHTFFVYLSHTWTLAVEEQFYLAWPALLLLLGKRRGLIAVALPLAICPFVRAYYATLVPANADWTEQFFLPHRFECVSDSLAAGCLLAGCHGWLERNTIYSNFLRGRSALIAPLWILLTSILPFPDWLEYFNRTITIVVIAICVDWTITFPTAMVGQCLNARPVRFVGVLSYSLYLWQQPFLNPYTQSRISYFPVNLILVVVASLSSYYCVERPGLMLRSMLSNFFFTRLSGQLAQARTDANA